MVKINWYKRRVFTPLPGIRWMLKRMLALCLAWSRGSTAQVKTKAYDEDAEPQFGPGYHLTLTYR